MSRKTGIILLVVLVILIGVISSIAVAVKNTESESSRVMRITGVTQTQVNDILKIIHDNSFYVASIEHDPGLDNMDFQGEKGFRIKTINESNVILYLDADNTVYSVRYMDKNIYSKVQDGSR